MIATRVIDSATPSLQALLRQVRGPAGLKVAARGLSNVARDHFDDLDRTRTNRLGGRRTHFWRAVRRSVQAPAVRGSVGVVGINHVGIRQRIDGGVIRPVKGKYLTIPARARAYGRTAREFDATFEIVDGRPALVENLVSRVRVSKKTGKVLGTTTEGGDVLFWLVRKVTQKPDPNALPSDAALADGAVQALRDYIAAQT